MDKIVVRLKSSEYLYDEKIEILKEGMCSSIFSISIIRQDSAITGYCNTSGYRRLGTYSELTAKALFIALEKIFEAIQQCTQFLIFPEEMVLNIDNIYIDERFSRVKFVYRQDYKCKYEKKLKILLAELNNITTEEGRLYLDIFRKEVLGRNLSYLKTKYVISQILGKINKDQTW